MQMHSIQYSTFLGLHIYSFFKELEQLVYFMFLKTAHLGKTSETALCTCTWESPATETPHLTIKVCPLSSTTIVKISAIVLPPLRF